MTREVLFYICFAAYAEETVQQREKIGQERAVNYGGYAQSDRERRQRNIGKTYLDVWSKYLPKIDLNKKSRLDFVRIVTEVWLNTRSSAGSVQLKATKMLVAHLSWQCAELLESERSGNNRNNAILRFFRDELRELVFKFLVTKFGELKSAGTGDADDTKRLLTDIWLAWLKPTSGSWRIYEQPTSSGDWMQRRRPKDSILEIKLAEEKKKFDGIMKDRGVSFVMNVDLLGGFFSLLLQSSYTDSRNWGKALKLIDDVLWSFYASSESERYPEEKRFAVMLPSIGECQWLPRCFQSDDRGGMPTFNKQATESLQRVLANLDRMDSRDVERELLQQPQIHGRLPHPDVQTVLAEVYRLAGAVPPEPFTTSSRIIQTAKDKFGADVTTWTYLDFGVPGDQHGGLALEMGSDVAGRYKLKLAPKFRHMAKALFLQLHHGIFEHSTIIRMWALIAERWGYGAHRARDLLRGVNWLKIYLAKYHRRKDMLMRNPWQDPLVQLFLTVVLVLIVVTISGLAWVSALGGWLLSWTFALFVGVVLSPALIKVCEVLLEQLEDNMHYQYVRVEATLESLFDLDVQGTIQKDKLEDWSNVDWKSFLPLFLRLDYILPSLTENVALCVLWTAQFLVRIMFPAWKNLVPDWALGVSVVALHVLAPALTQEELHDEIRRSRKLRTKEIPVLVKFFRQLDGLVNENTVPGPALFGVRLHTRNLASIDRLSFILLWRVLDWHLGTSWRRFLLTVSGYVAFALIGKDMPACVDSRSRTTSTSVVLYALLLVVVVCFLWYVVLGL